MSNTKTSSWHLNGFPDVMNHHHEREHAGLKMSTRTQKAAKTRNRHLCRSEPPQVYSEEKYGRTQSFQSSAGESMETFSRERAPHMIFTVHAVVGFAKDGRIGSNNV